MRGVARSSTIGLTCIPAVLSAVILHCALIDPPEKKTVRPPLLVVRITEINYHPLGEGAVDGDEYEFVELKNTGASTADLSDVAFGDGIDYSFPSNTKLDAGAFLVLASNHGEFSKRYGFAPFGVYSGRLANSGERISLKDLLANETFLSLDYGDNSPWPAAADGAGRSLVPVTTDPAADFAHASNWRISFRVNGSPGRDDPGAVFINEVLTHTDAPQTDAIELFNPNKAPIDIGNWFLTDRMVDPMKFRIPAGTSIPAGGFVVFDESDFNAAPGSPASFRLSEHGEEVFLFADSTGIRSGSYYHGFSFGAIENGVSFGRLVTSVGEEQFVAQKSLTLEAANAGPAVGPIVLSEIMYNPKNDRDEYLEIKNTGNASKALYDESYPDNTWKIDGIGFSFPKNTTIKSGEKILVVSNAIPVEEFRTLYKIPSDVQIFVKSADLSNSADTISLLKPEAPYIDSSVSVTTQIVPYMVVERIVYSDGGLWPGGADGSGESLQRKSFDGYAGDPKNWKAGTASPGRD